MLKDTTNGQTHHAMCWRDHGTCAKARMDLIYDFIEDQIPSVREDLDEAIQIAYNSFGHGYSDGELDTLKRVKRVLSGLEAFGEDE